MAAKDRKEKKAFERAKDMREILIKQLKTCDSDSFDKIMSKHKKNKANGQFSFPTLTATHAAIIQNLNFQIEDLIQENKKLFKVTADAAVADVKVELVVDQDTQAEVTMDAVEVNKELTVAPAIKVHVVTDADAGKKDAAVDTVNQTETAATVVTAQQKDAAPVLKVEEPVVAPKKAKAVTFNPVVSFHSVKSVSSQEPDSVLSPVNPEREKLLVAVRAQIKVLNAKVKYYDEQYTETKDVHYKAAHTGAKAIVGQIELLTDKYARNLISLSFYKSEVKDLLDVTKNSHAKEIHTHRGYKEFFLNAIAGLLTNIFYLAAAAYTGTFGVFKTPTDGAKKLKGFAAALDEVEENELDTSLDIICKC